MKLTLGQTLIRVHPLLPVLWAVAYFFCGADLPPMLCAFLLHESGHLLVAVGLMRMRADEIELTPFGGVITLRDMNAASSLQAFLTAAGGPCASLLGCLAAPMLIRTWPFHTVQAFARASLLLFLFNLIPALPLDGGRMMRAVLSRFLPASAVERCLTGAGYLIGALLCACSIVFALKGMLQFSPAFVGLYLIYAASKEARRDAARYIDAWIARRQKIRRQEALQVERWAAGAQTPVFKIMPLFHPGKYHLIDVLSPDGMRSLATLDESEIYEGILLGDGVTLEKCIKKTAEK